MVALVGRILVVPQQVCRPRVDRPDIVRHREVNDAVDHNGRRFDAGILTGLKSPGEAQVVHIGRRDLGERTVASSGVIAVKSGPAIGRWMEKPLVGDVLSGCDWGPACERRAECENDCGFWKSHAVLDLRARVLRPIEEVFHIGARHGIRQNPSLKRETWAPSVQGFNRSRR